MHHYRSLPRKNNLEPFIVVIIRRRHHRRRHHYRRSHRLLDQMAAVDGNDTILEVDAG